MENPGVFSVLGKSMDLAIAESKKGEAEDLSCDLFIDPKLPTLDRTKFMQFSPYYEWGHEKAVEYLPEIKKLIAEKAKIYDRH
jgi:hypothetical protein